MLSQVPFMWGYAATNVSGTPKQTNPGTTFTAGGNNTMSTAVSVLSALSQDVCYLTIGFQGINVSAGDSSALADLLVDPAGGTSWSTKIASLACGFTPTNTVAFGNSLWYHFPLWIKAGSTLGIKAQTNHTADLTAGAVIVHAFGAPSKPDSWWCGQAVETLGANTTSSQGVAVTPGSSSANGSWTTLGTSTKPYGALQFGDNGTANTTTTNGIGNLYHIGVGSNKLPGSIGLYSTSSSNESLARSFNSQPIWCNIPANTAIQAIGMSSSASPQNHNLIAYGVY